MENLRNFREQLINDGLPIQCEIIPDGKIHRFHIKGDTPGSLNGWYVLHDGKFTFGAYGCWKRGIAKDWQSKPKESLTSNDRKMYSQCLFKARSSREEKHKRAAHHAQTIWEVCLPANNSHTYLTKKRVSSHGIRIDKKNRLVIPIYDATNTICSLQFISPSGHKMFLKDGKKSGGFYLIGEPNCPSTTVYLGEGYATCATIHEVTSFTTVCAFDSGNLLSVAHVIKRKFPDRKIIIAADNDAYTLQNPGLTKGKEVASSIGADLVYPDFTGLNLESKPTDFNDLMLLSNIERVKGNLINCKTRM